jgi:methylated-DNA-[protein]-cysteine S-methyltransferase
MTARSFALFDTPIGPCAIVWSSNGIAGLQLPERDEQSTRAHARRRWPGANESVVPADVQRAVERIQAMLSRRGPASADTLADLTLDLDEVPDFHRQIYAVARSIPPGQTMTYGEIGKRLGVGPERARDIGQAMGSNPVPIIVPCHRVLGADGKMGGFSAPGGVATKRRMLEIEGAAALSAGPLFDR